jgi:hypothetical protein
MSDPEEDIDSEDSDNIPGDGLGKLEAPSLSQSCGANETCLHCIISKKIKELVSELDGWCLSLLKTYCLYNV